MTGSFRLATFFGIDLRVHWTFFFIVALFAFYGADAGYAGVAFSVAFILLLFLCVTLHEFGHALVALKYKIPVREIVLLPIGGVAVMNRIPENPKQELYIAIAGPLVNVAILAVLVPIYFFALDGFVPRTVEEALSLRLGVGSPVLAMVWSVIVANVVLIVFNLIPAFPLDGGRIFRALLAMMMPHVKATRIAARVGQVAAVLLVVLGLLTGNIFLAIVAFFIFLGAGAESAAAQAGTVLATRRVGDAYNKTAINLSIDSRMSHVIEHLLTSYQPDFAVINRGRLAGVVTRDDVLKWLSEAPSLYDVYVTEVMREEQQVVRVSADLTLDDVTKAMEANNTRVVAVFDGDHYMGLVSSEDIAEAQAVLTFLNRRLLDGVPPTQSPWPVPMRSGTHV